MSDHPILFSGPMVRALLEGHKTQTRRVIGDAPAGAGWYMDRVGSTGWQWTAEGGAPRIPFRPRYAVGDRLYVREAWRALVAHDAKPPRDLPPYMTRLAYEADGGEAHGWVWGKLRPGMHMPRWASRITMTVTDVRVQRLQEISAEDALAEGVIRQDPTSEDEEWNRRWCEEIGIEPDPMDPVWLAPGTRQGFGSRPNDPQWGPTPEFAFRLLWDSINAARGYGWAANPWVVAVSFSVERRNIDHG